MTGRALVIGAGASNGLGAALGRRFAAEGYAVTLAGRSPEKLEAACAEIISAGGQARHLLVDVTIEDDIVRCVEDTIGSLGSGPDVVIYNAGTNMPGMARAVIGPLFELIWRTACAGGFIAGREAAKNMVDRGAGTILFTGATASIRSRPPFVAFASAKAGLRAVAQGLAREFGPLGVHVGHVVIDGVIDGDIARNFARDVVAEKGEDGLLKPDDIAQAYWMIHSQTRSAWTFELDLRPASEPF
jgi:NAD(P)-dependent dehydrogenase (short-subunit alcohol dehydrogenase family)